jgi:hypothetical protein
VIISVSELVATGVIWMANEIHGLIKGHAAAQQALIVDQKTYCPPAITLPKDLPDWQIQLYKEQCAGVNGRLNENVPERFLIDPTQLIGPPEPVK